MWELTKNDKSWMYNYINNVYEVRHLENMVGTLIQLKYIIDENEGDYYTNTSKNLEEVKLYKSILDDLMSKKL